MKAQHTPGPWAFCNHTLCQATGNYLHLGKFVESPGLGGQAGANRRLIAAAPELLAALQWVMAGVAGCQKNPEYEAARAAIAKATGDQK